MYRFALPAVLFIAALFLYAPAMARTVALDPGQRLQDERSGWLPYAFATDSLATTVGAAAFSSGWFAQQAMAFNFWTSNTPTWSTDDENPQIVTNRPPPYMGSTLGGFDRLRAFSSGRCNDKSAVYYTSEMRLPPRNKPLRDIGLLNYYEVDWFEVVPFVEAGRVGPEYTRKLVFDDLKVNAGIDLRFIAFRNVFRVGWARSEEGNQIWAMFGQPFAS